MKNTKKKYKEKKTKKIGTLQMIGICFIVGIGVFYISQYAENYFQVNSKAILGVQTEEEKSTNNINIPPHINNSKEINF
jgi:capsule polysaccharide export protein KpsE/RkpR